MSEIFGKNLTTLRESKRLKQSEMPNLTGVSRATWSDYERGNTEPSFQTLLRISEFFGIEIDKLLKRDLSAECVDVHLTNSEKPGKNTSKVHQKVHPTVHLKDKKVKYSTNSEEIFLGEAPFDRFSQKEEKIMDALIMSIKALDAVNTQLLSDITRLEDENKRLKKEVPQISSEMDGASTKTA